MFYLYTLGWMVIWSLISIYVYKKDKHLAETKQFRIEELTLDALVILGGWPGCIYAQRKFRHKTKSAYQRRFRVLVIAWIMVYVSVWSFLWVGKII